MLKFVPLVSQPPPSASHTGRPLEMIIGELQPGDFIMILALDREY